MKKLYIFFFAMFSICAVFSQEKEAIKNNSFPLDERQNVKTEVMDAILLVSLKDSNKSQELKNTIQLDSEIQQASSKTRVATSLLATNSSALKVKFQEQQFVSQKNNANTQSGMKFVKVPPIKAVKIDQ
ncbi:MAG: hypothetical protein HKN48_13750 [Flavobacteriaceae bacterium]|nr:hypothetical protein [Flavobacteriaceae bacterium]